MNSKTIVGLLLLLPWQFATGEVVNFGTDANNFSIEFVPIGDAGNEDDFRVDYSDVGPGPAHIGGVSYDYSIAKHETSCGALTIAWEVGGMDLGGDFCHGFSAKNIGFLDPESAIEFVNWLNRSSGYHEAYPPLAGWPPGDIGFDSDRPARNAFARYFLASADEFYKAAFYDPVTNTYLDYSTGSNEKPSAVSGGTEPNTIVGIAPAEVDNAGGLSAYGTMAQVGNGTEMEETPSWFWSGVETGVVPYNGTRMRNRGLIHSFRIVSHLKVDTNGNDIVDLGDVDGLEGSLRTDLFTFLEIVPGDLDGVNGVEFADFLSLSDNFGTPGGYADGDIDGDGNVAFPDFLILSDNFGKGAAHAVPEPSSLHLLICGVALGFLRHRGR